MKKSKQKKKIKYRIYYLDLRKKFKSVFVERESLYKPEDITYYIHQMFYHVSKYKKAKFKIIVPYKTQHLALLKELFVKSPNNLVVKFMSDTTESN